MAVLSSSPAKLRRTVSCLLGVGIILAGAARAQQPVGIEGQVRDIHGRAIPSGVEVRLETPGGTLVSRQPCDSDGHYQFLGLSATTYRVVITADGYQTYQTNMDISNSPHVWTLNVYMTPLSKSATPTAEPSLNDEAAPKEARKNYDKGARALHDKHYDEARRRLEKALEEYPCYARAKTDLAFVDVEERKLGDAEEKLRQAIKCDAGYVEAYLESGQLYNVEKKYTDSETILDEGLRHSPSAWQLYFELGAAHFGMGRYKDAEEDYLKAQSFNADMPSVFHAKLANLYMTMHSYDRAYQEMQAYLRADPNGIYAGNIRNVIARMQASGVLKADQPSAARASPPKP